MWSDPSHGPHSGEKDWYVTPTVPSYSRSSVALAPPPGDAAPIPTWNCTWLIAGVTVATSRMSSMWRLQ